MKKQFLSFLLIFAFAFAACEKSVSENKSPNVNRSQTSQVSPVPTASIPKDGNYDGKGIVTKINNENGSVELKHEDIEDLMPAMQMEFNVKDKALLKDLKVGDKVDFTIEYKHPTETISAIKKAQ